MASSVKKMKSKIKRTNYKDSWLLECNEMNRPLAEKEINIRWCLMHGASADATSTCGAKPLHAAVRRGQTRIVKMLVEYKADVDIPDQNGETPLHLAVRYGDGTDHIIEPYFRPECNANIREDDTLFKRGETESEVDIIDLLLAVKANANTTDMFGDLPLHVAVRSGAAAVVLKLLDHTADVNIVNKSGDMPLHLATHRGEALIVKKMLDHNACVTKPNSSNNTPLHLAAHRGKVDIMDMLLDLLCINSKDNLNSKINVRNSDGDTPLHLAVRSGKTEVAARLLDRGAEVNAKNDAGFTPLHVAVDGGKKDIVKLLLKESADVAAFNNAGSTPLHLAVVKQHMPTVRLLLSKRDVNVNIKNSEGDTPLYLAVVDGDPATVELLLQNKADVDAISSKSNTPLHVAAYLGKSLFVDLLLSFQADVNKPDSNGNTPLHLAARNRQARVVRLLLDFKADVTIRNFDWNTPLTVARLYHFEGNEEVVTLLENAMKLLDSQAPLNDDRPQPHANSQNNSQVAILDKMPINQLETETSLMFPKKPDTFGVCGQLYETKLLSLVLIRALNDEQIVDFYLGTNNSVVGDMDDICLQYRVIGQKRPVVMFVQAKHREDPEKSKITVEDVQCASGDYSLRKYFDSYLKIKNLFQVSKVEEDPIFKRDFSNVECNLIIYTPAMERFSKKNTKRQESEKVRYLLNTGENPEVFQYDYDEDDVENFTKLIVRERFEKPGAFFLDFLISEKDKPDIFDKIARYHIVLAQEVLQLCEEQKGKDYRMWEFRPTFFESNCDYLIALKKTFVKELSTKRLNQSNINKEDEKNFERVLKQPCPTSISKLLGKLAWYNEKTKKLQLHDVAKKKFKAFLQEFDKIETNEKDINEAVKTKLLELKIKLPLSFGNLDMTFRGNASKVQKRMKAVANALIDLLKQNVDETDVDINDNDVGQNKKIEQSYLDVNGGIGSAVGNLLILDPDRNMLKFNLDKPLPNNATLFLKELKDTLNSKMQESEMNLNDCEKYKLILEQLSSYRFNINVEGFSIDSMKRDEYYVERLAKDYFNKLWFYTNQAQQDEVENIVKNEIEKYYNNEKDAHQIKFKIHSDAIFRSAHGEVQKWWKETGEVKYLTQKDDFFQNAKLNCFNNLLLTVLNYIYESRTCSIDFKFNPRVQQSDLQQIEAPAAFDLVLGETFKIFEKQSKCANIEGSQKIKDLVHYAEKLAKYYVAAGSDVSMMENILDHPESQGDIVINILQNNVEHEFDVGEEVKALTYSKRTGTSAVGGQLYKTKLLCLVLIRAINDDQIEDFLLGTNIRDIGDMDDICLRYKVKDRERPVALFLQTKHKEKGNLTVGTAGNPSGDFSLQKYFESCVTIRNRFQADNESSMFQGDFGDIDWNFIVYTPAEIKNIAKKENNERQVSDKVHYLISTNSKNDVVFQYKHDIKDQDLLAKMIVFERLKKLGVVLLEFILSEKDNLDVMLDKLIAQYHVLIGREVLQPCQIQQEHKEYRMWEFRPEFFEKESIYLDKLRTIIFNELSTIYWDKLEITDEDRVNCELVLQNQSALAISKVIGKLAIYNKKTKKLQLVADFKNALMANDEFKKLVEKFNEIEISNENIIYKAIQIKLEEKQFKLPSSFGTLDMTFGGTESKQEITEIADNFIELLKLNKVVDINDVLVSESVVEQNNINIYGSIKSAFGNLLVLDPDTNMLKFDSDNEALPENAALFLKELKEERHKPFNEELDSCRIKVSFNELPKDSLDGDEHDKNLSEDLLNNLWFYADQAREDEVELALRDEINRCYNKVGTNFSAYYGSLPDIIYLSSHEDIQNWWMQTSQSPYLTRKCELFERVKDAEIHNLLETVINFMLISKTSSVDIKFKQRVSKYFKFVNMHQIFNRMSFTLFSLFDKKFDDSINIELPEIEEPLPYSNYSSLGELVFTIEIHHKMEWVAMKLWALSTYSQYFLLAKAGPGSMDRRPREGFLLQQLCNGRYGHIIDGEKDPDDIYSFVTTRYN